MEAPLDPLQQQQQRRPPDPLYDYTPNLDYLHYRSDDASRAYQPQQNNDPSETASSSSSTPSLRWEQPPIPPPRVQSSETVEDEEVQIPPPPLPRDYPITPSSSGNNGSSSQALVTVAPLPPVTRTQPTLYPVKTADISAYPQYSSSNYATSPARPVLPKQAVVAAQKPSTRASTSPRLPRGVRREPLDERGVAEEVARNVSQILSATRQQQAQAESSSSASSLNSFDSSAAGSSSTVTAPPSSSASLVSSVPVRPTPGAGKVPFYNLMKQNITPRPVFVCSVCHRCVSSMRNLQRHRQTCPGINGRSANSSSGSIISVQAPFSSSWPQSSLEEAKREDRNMSGDSSSTATNNGSTGLHPLSVQTGSSPTDSPPPSASCPSSTPSTTSAADGWRCECCKKTVSSARSLRRHQGTCKLYIAKFGPPLDESVVVVPPEAKSSPIPPAPPPHHIRSPVETPSSTVISPVPADEKNELRGNGPTSNVCPNCGKQLCSSSNLKRHLATCKQSRGSPLWSGMESEMKEAVHAIPSLPPPSNTLKSSPRVSSPDPAVQSPSSKPAFIYDAHAAPKPYVTVGEHLREQLHHHDSQHQRRIVHHHPTRFEDGRERMLSSAASWGDAGPTVRDVVLMEQQKERLRLQAAQQRQLQAGHLVDDHLGYGGDNDATDGSDLEEMDESMLNYEVFEPKINTDRKPALQKQPQRFKEERKEYESIITTAPLGCQQPPRATPLTLKAVVRAPQSPLTEIPELMEEGLQCPDCFKTYSCRKNVKRHLMAVHKFSETQVNRMMPPPGNSSTLKRPTTAQLQSRKRPSSDDAGGSSWASDSRGQKWPNPEEMVDEKAAMARIAAELKREAEVKIAEAQAAAEGRKAVAELAEADTTTFNDDERGAQGTGEVPSPPLSLASSSSSLSVPVSSSNTPTVSLDDRTLLRDGLRLAPVPARPRASAHKCPDCSRALSSDYSLRRHRKKCPELRAQKNNASKSGTTAKHEGSPHEDLSNSSEPALAEGEASFFDSKLGNLSCSGCGAWFADERQLERHHLEEECHAECPDSTTQQRSDGRTSAPPMSSSSEHELRVPDVNQRKRPRSGDGEGAAARHLCEDCCKCYSSEWNLERHKRESCPFKVRRHPTGKNSSQQNFTPSLPVTEQHQDHTVIQVRDTQFVVAKSLICGASLHLSELMDHGDDVIHLDAEPSHFQALLDVVADPRTLTAENIDSVAALAEQIKCPEVFQHCERFVADELPNRSVMHAIRLAEQLKMTAIKQRLFDSISIEVFRSLAADADYRLMGAELKAELLEKWGTFL